MGVLMFLLLLLSFGVIFTEDITSVKFLFAVLVLLTYVLPSLFLWELFKESALVVDKYKFEFFLFVLLSYVGFLIGYVSSNKPAEVSTKLFTTDFKKLEDYSIIIGLIGLAGYGFFIINSGLSVYLMGHGSGNFSIGGYIYELRFFIFSSILLLYNIYLKDEISKRGKTVLIFFTILLVIDAYIQAQRGSWIRLGVIFMISFLLHQDVKKKITVFRLFERYKVIFTGSVFLALLLVFSVQMRPYANRGLPASKVITLTTSKIADNPQLLIGGSGIGEGNEFVTAYNAFYANEKVKIYDYGKKWLYGFINLVPRSIWKKKPTLFNFSTNEFALVSNYSLIAIPPGSVWTGIIDTYFRFGWFSPFFFVLFGYILGNVYFKAYTDFRYRFFYICIYIGFFYFFTQEMFPLIIFTIYMYAPILVATKACMKR